MGFYDRTTRLSHNSEYDHNGRYFLIDTNRLSESLSSLERVSEQVSGALKKEASTDKKSFRGNDNGNGNGQELTKEDVESIWTKMNDRIVSWVIGVVSGKDIEDTEEKQRFAQKLFHMANTHLAHEGKVGFDQLIQMLINPVELDRELDRMLADSGL